MLKINIEISETADGLSDVEKAVLSALGGGSVMTAEAVEGIARTVKPNLAIDNEKTETAEAPAEPEKPKRTRRTKAEIDAEKKAKAEEAKAEEEALAEVEAKTLQEELAEDDATEAEADEKPTMEDAVNAATKLVSDGRQADLKKVLQSLDTPRVSKLDDKDIPAFLKALKELG